MDTVEQLKVYHSILDQLPQVKAVVAWGISSVPSEFASDSRVNTFKNFLDVLASTVPLTSRKQLSSAAVMAGGDGDVVVVGVASTEPMLVILKALGTCEEVVDVYNNIAAGPVDGVTTADPAAALHGLPSKRLRCTSITSKNEGACDGEADILAS